jgi:hypothetical protein
MAQRRKDRAVLNLKSGEWVEVRSRQEILATLDERGCLDNLPFMPEMLQYCGRKLQVGKRADKTCDNIVGWSIRRMQNSVHLEGIRCEGSAHGACEAGCLIFWKEAWLKRSEPSVVSLDGMQPVATRLTGSVGWCTVESILAASQGTTSAGEMVYFCQATEVRKFTTPMKSWDPRQYIRDLRSGNLCSGLAGNLPSDRFLDTVLSVILLLRTLIISIYNGAQTKHNGYKYYRYPLVEGSLAKTPLEALNLEPGELVQVRSKEEIMATLNTDNRNRGLLFDGEMIQYCGGIYRVLRRVHHIIDEKTGKMMDMKYPCIVLESVYCRSDYHRLCPRAIYHYWRENWLVRASEVGVAGARAEADGAESGCATVVAQAECHAGSEKCAVGEAECRNA